MGRVTLDSQPIKPARPLRTGDLLTIRTEGPTFTVEVLQLSDLRGPASVAQSLYSETQTSLDLRLALAAERKLMLHPEGEREGRPSKRDRRQIGKLRGRF